MIVNDPARFVADPWKGLVRHSVAAQAAAAKKKAGATSTAKGIEAEKPPEFFVTISAQNPYRAVTALLGDSPPTPSGGGGGYEVVQMPGRVPVTVWRRADLVTMSLPIVIDNFIGGRSVQDVVDALWTMWAGDRDGPPPSVRLTARGWSVPFRELHWVISNLTWGDAEANSHGNRTRQALTLELTEYHPETRVGAVVYKSVPKKRAATHRKRHGTKTKSKRKVRVATGDTLATIAQVLELSGGWQALGLAQNPPITDPRSVTVGQELRLPAGVLVVGGNDPDEVE